MNYGIVIYIVTVGSAVGINSPYISPWQSIEAQVSSPIFIPHPLGQMPIKVDVQVRVPRDGGHYVFSGFGAGQRGDDDGDTQYGAVLFSYNELHVRLHVPVSSITTKGGLINTAGFVGPFDAYYTTADVRIRAWRICDFPPANFSSNIYGVGGPPYAPGGVIPHNLGVKPDLVVVQLRMADGFVYEADGAVFKDRRISSDRACGTVVAYDNKNIRVWGMAKRQGIDGLVGCAYRGWGTPYMATLAVLVISAWILPPEDIVFTQTTTITKNSAHLNTVPLSPALSIDSHLFIVKVKATDGNNNGFILYGAGTSLTDGSLTNYGGVVFGYNQSELSLWRPADANSNGYVWYMGGDLGGGTYPQTSSTADVTVDIIRTRTPAELNCGPGKCIGDWAQIIVICDCAGTGVTGQYCTEANGPAPSALQAGVTAEGDLNLHLGYKRNLTLKLAVPLGTTADTVVNVKASDSRPVMALGSLVVKETGNNIQTLTSSFSYSASPSSNLTGFRVITSGFLSLGNIVNSGASSLYVDNMIVLESEVYVQSVQNVTDGEQHSVTVSVMTSGITVWTRDVTYTINTEILTSNKTPEVLTSFPAIVDLEHGRMTRVSVDLWMPLANPDIEVTVRSPDEGEGKGIRAVRLSVTEVGENFQLPVVLERYMAGGKACDDVITIRSLSLVFPTHFANKDAFVSNPLSNDDLIRLETVVLMESRSEPGTSYPMEFIILVDQTILWNSTFRMTSVESTNPSVPTEMKAPVYNNQLDIGQEFSTNVSLTLPELGIHIINLSIISLKGGGKGISGLILLSASIVETGSNILCSSLTIAHNKTENSTIQNLLGVSLNITNTASSNTSAREDDNQLILSLAGVTVPGYTTIGDVYTIDVRSGSLNVVYTFNVIGTVTFDQNLVYITEIVHSETETCLSGNQTFEFFVNITTERNKSPGALYITFPAGETVFSVHDYKITHVGENLLPCFQSMQLDRSLDKYVEYSDGSLGNVTMEFPIFCNREVITDILGDILTIRVTAGIRKDTKPEITSTKNFTVVISSPGLASDVTSSIELIVKTMTVLPRTAIVTGVVIAKHGLNVSQLPVNCHVKYSIDGKTYYTTTVVYEQENLTDVVYTLSLRCAAAMISMEESAPGSSSCCVLHSFLTLNVEDHVTVYNDVSGSLLSKLPYVFDETNDTCLELPVQGQSPAILWMRMNISGLWGLSLNKFRLRIVGQDIKCDNQNKESVILVSFPSSVLIGNFHGDITLCRIIDEFVAPSGGLSSCSYQCPCAGPQCSDVFVYMATSNSSKNWTLCSLSAENY